MATFLELSELIKQPAFKQRIQYALWVVCGEKLNDGNASAGDKTYARKKLKGAADNDEIQTLAIRCVSDPTIAAAGAAATDADIKTVVAASFSALVN